MKMLVRALAHASIWALTLALTAGSASAAFPDKPVKILVPSAAGGFSDLVARQLSPRLQALWGQPVIIENKPGALGTLATRAMINSPADGYTLSFIATPHALLPLVSKTVPYDLVRDTTWVAVVASSPVVLVAVPTLGVKDAKAAFALAKANPGKFSYAAPGQLATGHRTMELLKRATGTDIRNIPYASGAPAVTDLLGGHVQFMAISVPTVISQIKAGKLTALGVSSLARVVVLPDVPTLAEAGFPGFESVEWYGLVVPAGTPQQVVAKLSEDIQKVLRSAEVSDHIAGLGAFSTPGGPHELELLYRAEVARWQKLVPELGLRLD
jgi:tripartite-type tricarboxylate transporter receptor subunit TctC